MKKILFLIIFVLFSLTAFAACITIKDLDTKIISTGKHITVYAYKIRFDSTCDQDVTVRGEVKAIDDEGYKLHSAYYSMNVPKYGDVEYSDTMMILNDVADKIDKFIAGGSVYR